MLRVRMMANQKMMLRNQALVHKAMNQMIIGATESLLSNKLGAPPGQLEMVGLMPQEDIILENGPDAVAESVQALGLLSKGQLSDDRRGSVRNFKTLRSKDRGGTPELESSFISGRAEEQFNALMIEGLAVAPGLSEQPAKLLLSKIAQYAFKERSLTVLSKQAYLLWDGSDLTEHYVNLGFEKVMFEDGSYELLYSRWKKGSSAAGEQPGVANPQIIVGLNLWTGL